MKNADFNFKEWLIKTHGIDPDDIDDDYEWDSYREEWLQYLESKYDKASLVFGVREALYE